MCVGVGLLQGATVEKTYLPQHITDLQVTENRGITFICKG